MEIISKEGRIIPVLYEDNHLLVVNKPAGLLVQADRTGNEDLLSLAKQYVKDHYQKPGNVFLGLIHRLDRPVSGVVVFARTSKAAGRLSGQIKEREVSKRYLALVQGRVPEEGTWQDTLERKGVNSFISSKGKKAVLSFRRLGIGGDISLVAIKLITGRHHQIRVQFASRGYPLLGDFRYAQNPRPFGNRQLSLHALSFTFSHPTKKQQLAITCRPDESWNNEMNECMGTGWEEKLLSIV